VVAILLVKSVYVDCLGTAVYVNAASDRKENAAEPVPVMDRRTVRANLRIACR